VPAELEVRENASLEVRENAALEVREHGCTAIVSATLQLRDKGSRVPGTPQTYGANAAPPTCASAAPRGKELRA